MRTFLTFIFLFVSALLVAQIDADHLMVGETAPLITGKDQNGKSINSSEILKDSQILLIFYRGNWCPYCKKHLSSLETHLKELQDKGVFVIVVSPEKIEKTQETANEYNNDFSIIHDVGNRIMTAYKVVFTVNQQSVPKYYEKITEKINEYNEDNNNVLPVPATYLIDQSGKISYVHYDPDYKKRSNLDEILTLLD
jgi:peroxiredoxin